MTDMPEHVYIMKNDASEYYCFCTPGDCTTKYIRADVAIKETKREIEWRDKRHARLRHTLLWVSDLLLHSLGGNIPSNEDAKKIIEFAKEYGVAR